MEGMRMNRRDDLPRDRVSYEPPRVERVLTPAELEHEILYAGVPTGQDEEVPAP
jgi:hypothetical protein